MAADETGLEARLQALEAYEQIRQMAARYAYALDSRNIDEIAGLFVEDVRTGDSRIDRHALASWFDLNPLHHDETFARAAGYDAPLAVEMLNAGLLASYATDWLGAEAVRRFRTRFRNRVWPSDTVTCTSQAGVIAVQAWATVARERA